MALLGPPGIGKTAVAEAVIKHDRILRHFGNRIKWIQCRGLISVNQFIDSIYDAFASENASQNLSKGERLPSFRNILGDQSSHLIILDGFDYLWESSQSDIEYILHNILEKNGTVMLTMQGSTVLPPAFWQTKLAPLSIHSAKIMFYSICPPSYRYPSNQVETLLQQTDCYPLAILAVANACKSGFPPSQLSYGSYGSLRLDQTAADSFESLDESIRMSVNRTTIQQDSASTRLLSILSMLPSGALHTELRALAPSIPIANELAETLTRASLAYSDPGRRIRLLSPIRSYVLKYHQLDEQSREFLYNHYFSIAKQGLCRPRDRYFVRAIDALVSNQRNIEAILDDALSHGCIPAVEATLQYSTPRCAIKPRLDLVKKALLVAQKEKLLPLIARCFQRHGEMAIASGSYFEGRDSLNGGIEHYQLLENPIGVAECRLGIADCIWINSIDDGLCYLEEVLSEFRSLDDVQGQANCLLKIGRVSLGRRHYDDALTALDKAYRKFEEVQDSHGMAQCRITTVLRQKMTWENMKATLYTAIQTFQSFGDRENMGKSFEFLAQVHLQERNLEDAQSKLQSAIDEYEWLGQKLKVAQLQRRLGDISDHEVAIALYRKAIPQFWESRFIYAGAECRLSLGQRYIALGRYSDALLSLERARRELLNNGTTELAFYCLKEIIGCLCAEGQISEAELTLENNLNEIRFHVCKLLQLPSSTEMEVAIKEGELAVRMQKLIEDGDVNASEVVG